MIVRCPISLFPKVDRFLGDNWETRKNRIAKSPFQSIIYHIINGRKYTPMTQKSISKRRKYINIPALIMTRIIHLHFLKTENVRINFLNILNLTLIVRTAENVPG